MHRFDKDALTRVSSKKVYDLEFYREDKLVLQCRCQPSNGFSSCAQESIKHNVIADEMKVTDPETGKFIYYTLWLVTGNPHTERFIDNYDNQYSIEF